MGTMLNERDRCAEGREEMISGLLKYVGRTNDPQGPTTRHIRIARFMIGRRFVAQRCIFSFVFGSVARCYRSCN